LLLGDSIRKSYQLHVAGLLKDVADVAGSEENGQTAAHTLECLDRWIDELGRPDLVHWNNGIHDSGYKPNRDPIQYPIEEYLANLAAILSKLQKLTSRIIWASSTPVHRDRPFREDGWSWRNEEIVSYNSSATGLMVRNDIPINDLHRIVDSRMDDYMRGDLLHLNEAGQQACAQAVASIIRDNLPD